MASRIEPLLTVADLDALPEDDGNRYELIGGELFVSRAPGIPHQRLLQNLQVEFALYLKAKPDRKSTRLNSSHIQKSRMPSSA